MARSRESFAKNARPRGKKVGKIAERRNPLRSTNFPVWTVHRELTSKTQMAEEVTIAVLARVAHV